jgi:hypothetical protein
VGYNDHDEHAEHGAHMVNAMLRTFVISAIPTVPIIVTFNVLLMRRLTPRRVG